MKKEYIKPNAEYIKFYSEEEITDQEGSIIDGGAGSDGGDYGWD